MVGISKKSKKRTKRKKNKKEVAKGKKSKIIKNQSDLDLYGKSKF